jgi:hypothetical protein
MERKEQKGEEDLRKYVNDGEEMKIKMIEIYSNVRKKDVKEEYQIERNRESEEETN